MSNQPYEDPYEGYDPYQQQAPQSGWPQQQTQGYDEAQQAQQPQAQQYTQQWEGQTWETQVQPPAPAADTAFLPPQAYGQHGQGQGQQHGQGHGQQQAHGYGVRAQPLPQEAGGQGWDHAQSPSPSQRHSQPRQPQVRQQSAPPTVPATGEGAPGYGAPTITGNPRVTDAQRARAEGRSPVIEPGIQPAALTAGLGLLLSGAAAIGQYALVVPLVLLQAVTAAGWFRLNGMWPARQGIALAFMGAVTADVALLAAGRENAPAAILGTLGVWVLLTLVLQLRSHADADTRMSGLMATVASAALSIVAAGHLAAEPDAVTVGAAAVAVAILARALPLPTPASVVVSLLAAVGAGVAVGGLTDLGSRGGLLGLGAGVCALIGHRVASYDYPSRFVHFTAGVALPLAAAAPAVYLLGRALG
jgi:hypothetical protein